MPISVKINWDELQKIDQKTLFQGKKGRYLDLKLVETKGNQYGDDYFVTQMVKPNPDGTWPKTPILGNARVLGQRQQHQDEPRQPRNPGRTVTTNNPVDEDVPF